MAAAGPTSSRPSFPSPTPRPTAHRCGGQPRGPALGLPHGSLPRDPRGPAREYRGADTRDSYLNPILAYGVEALVERAARSGLDGFIVPDYPDDEPELGLAEKCAAAGLALVPLIAPTTSIDRASALAAASASPFLYVVLRLGVTGRKTELGNASLERLAALKTRTASTSPPASGCARGRRSRPWAVLSTAR